MFIGDWLKLVWVFSVMTMTNLFAAGDLVTGPHGFVGVLVDGRYNDVTASVAAPVVSIRPLNGMTSPYTLSSVFPRF